MTFDEGTLDEHGECRYEIHQLEAEVKRLQAIVAKLPKCWRLVDGKLVQDVPMTPEMKVFVRYDDDIVRGPFVVAGVYSKKVQWVSPDSVGYVGARFSCCYDTQEAAEAAGEGE